MHTWFGATGIIIVNMGNQTTASPGGLVATVTNGIIQWASDTTTNSAMAHSESSTGTSGATTGLVPTSAIWSEGTSQQDSSTLPWDTNSTTPSFNGTDGGLCKNCRVPGTILGILMVVIIIVALVGNALVLLVFCRIQALRKQTNLFIISLAVADILTALLPMPMYAAEMFQCGWVRQIPTVLCFSNSYLTSTFTNISVYTLAAISFERWYVISRPLTYRNLLKPRRILLTIVVLWLLSFCYGVLNIVWFNHKSNEELRMYTRRCDQYTSPAFAIFDSCIKFWVPLTIMLFAYIKIYLIVRVQLKKIGTLAKKDFSTNTLTENKDETSSSQNHGNSSSAHIEHVDKKTSATLAKYVKIFVKAEGATTPMPTPLLKRKKKANGLTEDALGRRTKSLNLLLQRKSICMSTVSGRLWKSYSELDVNDLQEPSSHMGMTEMNADNTKVYCTTYNENVPHTDGHSKTNEKVAQIHEQDSKIEVHQFCAIDEGVHFVIGAESTGLSDCIEEEGELETRVRKFDEDEELCEEDIGTIHNPHSQNCGNAPENKTCDQFQQDISPCYSPAQQDERQSNIIPCVAIHQKHDTSENESNKLDNDDLKDILSRHQGCNSNRYIQRGSLDSTSNEVSYDYDNLAFEKHPGDMAVAHPKTFLPSELKHHHESSYPMKNACKRRSGMKRNFSASVPATRVNSDDEGEEGMHRTKPQRSVSFNLPSKVPPGGENQRRRHRSGEHEHLKSCLKRKHFSLPQVIVECDCKDRVHDLHLENRSRSSQKGECSSSRLDSDYLYQKLKKHSSILEQESNLTISESPEERMNYLLKIYAAKNSKDSVKNVFSSDEERLDSDAVSRNEDEENMEAVFQGQTASERCNEEGGGQGALFVGDLPPHGNHGSPPDSGRGSMAECHTHSLVPNSQQISVNSQTPLVDSVRWWTEQQNNKNLQKLQLAHCEDDITTAHLKAGEVEVRSSYIADLVKKVAVRTKRGSYNFLQTKGRNSITPCIIIDGVSHEEVESAGERKSAVENAGEMKSAVECPSGVKSVVDKRQQPQQSTTRKGAVLGSREDRAVCRIPSLDFEGVGPDHMVIVGDQSSGVFMDTENHQHENNEHSNRTFAKILRKELRPLAKHSDLTRMRSGSKDSTPKSSPPRSRTSSNGTRLRRKSSILRFTVKHQLRENRAARLFAIVISAFVLCYLPYGIWFLQIAFRDIKSKADWVWDMTQVILYLSSALNPFIYGFYSKSFRTAVKYALTCQDINSISRLSESKNRI